MIQKNRNSGFSSLRFLIYNIFHRLQVPFFMNKKFVSPLEFIINKIIVNKLIINKNMKD